MIGQDGICERHRDNTVWPEARIKGGLQGYQVIFNLKSQHKLFKIKDENEKIKSTTLYL